MRLGRILSIPALVTLAWAQTPAPTNLAIGTTVLRAGVKRLGINLGQQNFYDSGQMMKNLIGRNPGFEPLIYQSVMRCAAGTPSSCTDDSPWSAWPAGFWNGASYEIIWGAAKGRTGVISSFAEHSGSTGSVYNFSNAGAAPAAGDYILLRKPFTGGAEAGWWPHFGGGGAISTETRDLPPTRGGVQCLRINALPRGADAGVNSYFDSSAGVSFVQLNGSFQLAFQAKGLGGVNQLRVNVRRGANSFTNQVVNLQPGWQTYRIAFSAVENGTAVGTAEVDFDAVSGTELLLDDVSLKQTNGSSKNPTVFRDAVFNAVTVLKPGILRDWSGQLGDTLDNQLAPDYARKRAGFSAFGTDQSDIQYGLHDFLQVCLAAGAEPWYVIPITFSKTEMANLVEYLQGSAHTPYGAKRAALGRAEPWTGAFARIHLEFGNESWNGTFKGGGIDLPVPYGNRASELFAAARQSHGYDASKFDLVVGGQAVYVDRNRQILAASTQHDTLAVAPYLMNQVDTFDSVENLFGPLFAEPEQVNTAGYMAQNLIETQIASRPTALSVYETNLHTTQGTITGAALNSLTPSLGAGLAVADHMLMMLRDLNVRDQLLWQLPQYFFYRSDWTPVRLWGAVVDMGVTDRRRPQYLALALANEAISGDMLKVTVTGANPVWNQPAMNGVSATTAHYLQAYAFSKGTTRSLILFNLNRTQALPVTFSGTGAPQGNVTLKRLQAANVTDNNESANNVTVVSGASVMNTGALVSLPANTMTLLTWQTKR